MIRTADEMKVDLRENMRGGTGTVKIQHIFQAQELKGHSRMVGRVTLESNCSVGLHPHENEEEIYYILSGKGLVVDDDQERVLTAGDAVITGDGSSHSIANIGDENLEFVAVILTYA